MQVVSGPIGKERIHFEAPAAPRIEKEMGAFLDWFNGKTDIDPVMKAGLAHLSQSTRSMTATAASPERSPTWRWLVPKTVHNGSTACRHKSGKNEMPTTIFSNRRRKPIRTSRCGGEWFLGCLGRSIDGAQTVLGAVLAKAKFWDRARGRFH